jgi:TonB family protein
MQADSERARRLLTCGMVFIVTALFVAGCGGQRGGGCTLPPSPPMLAGTPIPPQPIPQGAGVTTNVSVVVTVVVDANGNVTSDSIKTSSQNALIDEAALTLVRNSKFNPGTPGCGTTTPDTTNVTVPFSPTA